ncbi:deoxynucleotide monophosphate kinase family protein [Streptomyces exfoliatus]|uniref:deoxynucleotide monophosphate kinase family protein n=1 Tax=Streptomyces exfoliatus TaxID=1905 RepID=UPI0037AA4EA1
MIPLVGFAGAARSGKDAAAQALLSVGWSRRAFADKVKGFLAELDPILDVEADVRLRLALDEGSGWEAVKAAYPEVRRLLQRCGTDAGRRLLGEDVWVDALFRDYASRGPTVITDVRFPNEAEAIRARGGRVVAVQRPGQALITEAGHVSENALAGHLFDGVIHNDGTVGQLHDRVTRLITAIL